MRGHCSLCAHAASLVDGMQQLHARLGKTRCDKGQVMKGPGFCILCDKPLFENNEYTEVEVEWSNKSRMKVAICKEDAGTHAWNKPEGKQKIQEWHWTYWEKQGATVDKGVILV